ncbi:MAG: restriction endonuclease subunit S [Clostridium perfringens]|nr:restriction endonuclease subunit S [Clostridium perfringens]
MKKELREGYKITELGEIPNEWKIKKLSDVSEIIMGQSPNSNSYNNDGIGIAFFQGKTEFGRINPIVKKWCSNPIKISKPLDILISVRAPVGAVNINNIEACIGRGLGAIRQNEFSNYRYLYYAIQQFQDFLLKSAQGSTFEAINSNDLKSLKIPIPSLGEQEKIAEILSVVDEQIENTEKLIQKNQELKKGLMQQLLTKGIGHTEFKKTELGYIPKEWGIKKIEEICEILDSKRVPLNGKQRLKMQGDIPYYGANAIVDYINDYIFDDELILIAEDGGNFGEFREKPIAFYVKGKCWVNNHAHVLKAIECENSKWIFYNLVHKDITEIVQGGTRAKLNQKDLKNIKIPFPNLDEQKEISSILSLMDKRINNYKNKKIKNEMLKLGLMQQLLMGKKRV